MSIEMVPPPCPDEPLGVPELTELGKHIEVLRIRRGLSKQHLARFARTSRQQLWRVLTGKSELSTSLRERLAEVLQVNPAELTERGIIRAAAAPTARSSGRARQAGASEAISALRSSEPSAAPLTFDRFLVERSAIERALRALPSGVEGRQLKRALLDALEDLALERSLPLPRAFFEIRRRVLAGEL